MSLKIENKESGVNTESVIDGSQKCKSVINSWMDMDESDIFEPMDPGHVDPSLPLEAENRYVLFPIEHLKIWESAEAQEECFWRAQEIDMTQDLVDWKMLTENEKHFILHILAFFAGSDGIVLENLLTNVCQEIKIPEVQYFYSFQAMMENIHSHAYSRMIDTLAENKEQKTHLFHAIDTIPCIGEKAKWGIKWIGDDKLVKKAPIMMRLVAFAAVEGIFFSGSFCAIFWLKKRGLMPGLAFGNELISRDEGMHTDFAIQVYSMLHDKYGFRKLTQKMMETIMKEALQIEKEFIIDALPCNILGMNSNMMSDYLEFVTDRLMAQFGYEKIYNTSNPFTWMEMISADGKTNMFEKRVGEYTIEKSQGEFSLDTDF
jgi:ribonucleoside-diphosphate reductase beta chain